MNTPRPTKIAISNNQATFAESQRQPYFKKRGKPRACLCCSQNHPLHMCDVIKAKTLWEKFEFVRIKALWRNCLKDTPVIQSGVTMKHVAGVCPSSFRCNISGCGAPHHTLANPWIPAQSHQQDHTEGLIPESKENGLATSYGTAAIKGSGTELLQVIPLRVVAKNGNTTNTYAMLDSGPEITVMYPSFVKQLDLRGKSDHLVLSTLSKYDEQHQGERVSIAVESLIDNKLSLGFIPCVVRKGFANSLMSPARYQEQEALAPPARCSTAWSWLKEDFYDKWHQCS